MELIQGVIDECDYYIMPSAYGSVSPKGVGLLKWSVICFKNWQADNRVFHKDPDAIEKRTEQTEEGQKKFKEFRDLARTCQFGKLLRS